MGRVWAMPERGDDEAQASHRWWGAVWEEGRQNQAVLLVSLRAHCLPNVCYRTLVCSVASDYFALNVLFMDVLVYQRKTDFVAFWFMAGWLNVFAFA